MSKSTKPKLIHSASPKAVPVGEYFRKLRKKAGKTQQEAGRVVGYPNSQNILNFEKGRAIPPDEIAVRLCEFYGEDSSKALKLLTEARLNRNAVRNEAKEKQIHQQFLIRLKKNRATKKVTKQRKRTVRAPSHSSVNQFLRDLRIKSGKTQMDAARFLMQGTPQYISNFEREICDPSLEMAIRLCEYYGGNRNTLQKLMFDLYRMELDKRFRFKSSEA